jgi:hypothetical protein
MVFLVHFEFSVFSLFCKRIQKLTKNALVTISIININLVINLFLAECLNHFLLHRQFYIIVGIGSKEGSLATMVNSWPPIKVKTKT